jgi:hypothetical protein
MGGFLGDAKNLWEIVFADLWLLVVQTTSVRVPESLVHQVCCSKLQ